MPELAKSVKTMLDSGYLCIAIKEYARQAKNRKLELDAAEIRIKAERRLGEMLRETPKNPGTRLKGGDRISGGTISEPPENVPTLTDMGIDKKLSARSQKLADMPEEKFEGMVGKWRELAIERNSKHGLQLSQEDKRNMARVIYHGTPEKEREEKKKALAQILSVSERTVREWLSRIDKDAKEARNKRIFNLWMSCHSQEEIAEREGINQATISRHIEESCNMADLPERIKPSASHLVDFEVPLYNVWKQQTKSSGSKHPGNSEPTFVDNLLYS